MYAWWSELNERIKKVTKSCTIFQKANNEPAVALLHLHPDHGKSYT